MRSRRHKFEFKSMSSFVTGGDGGSALLLQATPTIMALRIHQNGFRQTIGRIVPLVEGMGHRFCVSEHFACLTPRWRSACACAACVQQQLAQQAPLPVSSKTESQFCSWLTVGGRNKSSHEGSPKLQCSICAADIEQLGLCKLGLDRHDQIITADVAIARMSFRHGCSAAALLALLSDVGLHSHARHLNIAAFAVLTGGPNATLRLHSTQN